MGSLLIILMIANAINPVNIASTEGNPEIDGKMGAGEWDNAVLYECSLISFSPILGESMDDSMNVYIRHNGKEMFIMFNVYQDSNTLIEKQGNRDSGLDQDRVGIMIDPMGNKQEFFWIVVGLSGTVNDSRMLRSSKRGEDYTWDCNIESAVSRTGYGYNVEMAIPFNNFRASSSSTQQWNINFYRAIAHSGHLALYSFTENISSDYFYESLFPVVLDNIVSQREPLEVMPYGIYGASFNGDFLSRGNAGADIRYPINSHSVVNAALNPDFSQIEGDALSFDYNNEYARYYSEYRPFFTEEMKIFDTDNSIFYSRSIVNPYAALKYSYKDNKNQFGVIAAYDMADSLIGNKTAYNGVLRYTRQFGSNRFGTMLLERYDENRRNSFVLSADGMIALPGDVKWIFNTAGSSMDNDSSNIHRRGIYHDSYAYYRNSNLTIVGHIYSISPDFDNDLGYITRVNTHYGGGYAEYAWIIDNGFINKIMVSENFGISAPYDCFDNLIHGMGNDSFSYNANDSITQFYETKLASVFLGNNYAHIAVQGGNKILSNVNIQYLYVNLYSNYIINKYVSGNVSFLYGYTPDYNYERLGKRIQFVSNIYFSPAPQIKFSAGSMLYNFDADTSKQAVHYRDIGNVSEQWRTYTVDCGVTYAPITNLSFKFIAERLNANFAPGFYDAQRVIMKEDRAFFVMEYEPSPGNVIYFGARYNRIYENPIQDGHDNKVIFFKFSSKFFI